jgi:hypothetical protein
MSSAPAYLRAWQVNSSGKGGTMMRKAIRVCALLFAAAAVAPLAAQAQSNRDDGLTVKLAQPVNFAPPTADCPEGVASYGITLHAQTGSGTNCIQAEVPVDCPAGVVAQFCQNVPVRTTLNVDGSVIEGDVTILEAWTCDAICSVEQTWSGAITHATRRFHALEGGLVSGGGLFAFDPVTFQLVTFDETLVITAAD